MRRDLRHAREHNGLTNNFGRRVVSLKRKPQYVLLNRSSLAFDESDFQKGRSIEETGDDDDGNIPF